MPSSGNGSSCALSGPVNGFLPRLILPSKGILPWRSQEGQVCSRINLLRSEEVELRHSPEPLGVGIGGS